MATEGASISEASIGEKLKTSSVLQAQHVEVHDVSGGCGQSFEVIIVSGAFKGKPLLQRHRMVNSCLEGELKQIHAFSQKTYTPEQWEAQSNKS